MTQCNVLVLNRKPQTSEEGVCKKKKKKKKKKPRVWRRAGAGWRRPVLFEGLRGRREVGGELTLLAAC